MKMNVQNLGFCCAIAQGMFFGLVHILIQSAVRMADITNSMGLLVRFFLSSVILLPLALKRIQHTPLPKDILWKVCLAAFGMLSTTLLLYASYRYISTGMGVTLHYIYPVVTMVVSVLLFHAKLTWRMLLSIGMSFLGILFLCDLGGMGASILLGALLAIASAMAFSAYLLWMEHQNLNVLDPIVLTSLISFFNTAGLIIYNTVQSSLTLNLPPKSVLLLMASGIVGVLAMLTLNLAVKYAGAVYTAILGTLEPITSTIGGALILHETIRGTTVLGSALVVAAVVVATLSSSRDGQNRAAAGQEQ